MEAAVAAHDRDRTTEEETLEDAAEQVEVLDEAFGVFPVVVLVDVEDVNAVEITADDAHEVGHDRERGNHEDAGQEPRHHEVMHGVGSHAFEGIDLLGNSHCAEFSRHCRAYAASKHRRGEHRAELADERHVDYGTEPRFQTKIAKNEITLDCKHHADEGAGERDNRQAQYAHLIKV